MAFLNQVINGSDILLKIGDTAGTAETVLCATSHSIELTNSVREISCKGSGDFTSSEYGRFSWTVSTDALLNLDSTASTTYATYSELMDLMLAKTIVKIESIYDQDSDATDTYSLTGEGIITSINKTAGDNENTSYSVSIQGRGELTQTIVNTP